MIELAHLCTLSHSSKFSIAGSCITSKFKYRLWNWNCCKMFDFLYVPVMSKIASWVQNFGVTEPNGLKANWPCQPSKYVFTKSLANAIWFQLWRFLSKSNSIMYLVILSKLLFLLSFIHGCAIDFGSKHRSCETLNLSFKV